MNGRIVKTLGVLAVATTGVIFPLALPDALAQNVSGSSVCAGGPTHFAGVKYTAASGNGGQIIFTNPNTGANEVYDMWDYGDSATVYAPWSSALWWVEANSVSSAKSVCS